VGDIFGADDALLALALHLVAAEADERGRWQGRPEGGDELRAVVVAAGLAGREEDARVGGIGDNSV